MVALKDCEIEPWSANVNDLDRATAEKGELPLPQFPWTPFTFSESVAKKRTRSKKYKNRKVRLEEAEQSRGPREGGESRGGFRPAGSDRGGSRYSGDVRSYGSGEKRSGGSYSSRNRSKDS